MRKILFIAALTLLTISVIMTVNAVDTLTLDRAVQIDEYSIVLDFSAPVEFNRWGNSNSPYFAVRIVDGSNTVQKIGSTYAQWPGIIRFTDENHDKIIFTLTDSRLGCNTVSDILSFGGQTSELRGSYVRFCIEEKVFSSSGSSDGKIDNITAVGEYVKLTANRNGNSDGIYVDITSDSGYMLDKSKFESVFFNRADADVYIDGTLPPEDPKDGTDTAEPAENTPARKKAGSLALPAIAIAAVAAAVVTVIAVITGKDKK